jgi:hypothetical protein
MNNGARIGMKVFLFLVRDLFSMLLGAALLQGLYYTYHFENNDFAQISMTEHLKSSAISFSIVFVFRLFFFWLGFWRKDDFETAFMKFKKATKLKL